MKCAARRAAVGTDAELARAPDGKTFLAIWAREKSTRVYVTHNLEEAARLADRVVVLSRRPGQVRDILKIDVPVAERGRPEHTALLVDVHRRLWALIRDEAATADREIQHAWSRPQTAPHRSAAAASIRRRAGCCRGSCSSC